MNRNELKKKARAAAEEVLRANGYLSAVDMLLAMNRLSKENYERWRFRQVPHLEKVLPGSLNEHAFFLRELRDLARELKLKPSPTSYMSWGKGRRQLLRFSKYGNPRVEESFSTHYVLVPDAERSKSRPHSNRRAVAGIPAKREPQESAEKTMAPSRRNLPSC